MTVFLQFQQKMRNAEERERAREESERKREGEVEKERASNVSPFSFFWWNLEV